MKKIPPSELKRVARRIGDTEMLTVDDAQLMFYAIAQVFDEIATFEEAYRQNGLDVDGTAFRNASLDGCRAIASALRPDGQK